MAEHEKVRALLQSVADVSTRGLLPPDDLVQRRVAENRRRSRLAIVLSPVLAAALVVTTFLFSVRQNAGPESPVLTGDTWERLPFPPLTPRDDATMGWTGRELLVWGGVKDQLAFSDGASYDTETSTWTRLPKSPLGQRADAASVWTGTEWIIWGGYTFGNGGVYDDAEGGAAYNPAKRRWRMLPDTHVPYGYGDASLLWTGSEVIVGGGSDLMMASESVRYTRSVNAYDPRTNRWRALEFVPGDVDADFALVGGLLYVVFMDYDPASEQQTAALARYDEATRIWSPVERSGTKPARVGSMIAIGRDLITFTYDRYPGASQIAPALPKAYRFDTRSGRWSRLSEKGMPKAVEGINVTVGSTLVRIGPNGKAGAWDSKTDTWRPLPDIPETGKKVSAVATSDGVFAWNGSVAFHLH